MNVSHSQLAWGDDTTSEYPQFKSRGGWGSYNSLTLSSIYEKLKKVMEMNFFF